MILESISEINRELRIQVAQNVYLIYGSDIYLKNKYLSQITKIVLPEGSTMLNHYKITDKVIDTVKLEDLIYQIPFGGKILIVANDLSVTAQTDKDIARICELIAEVQEGTVLVLMVGDNEFDDKKSAKAKKIIKAVDENGAVFKVGFQKRTELADFIRTKIERGGAEIDMPVVYSLLDYCGENLDLLLHEAEKLSLYAKGSKISEETIYKVCSPTIEGNVYQISRKMFRNDVKGTMLEIDNLIYNQVEPIRIITTLAYQYGDMLSLKLGMEQGKTAAEMKSIMKIKAPESIVSAQMRDIRRIPLVNLQKAAELILEGEYTLKTVSNDSRIVLEKVIVEVMSCIIK